MYKYYNTDLERNQVKDMGISKPQILSIFRDPRTGQELPLKKKNISIDRKDDFRGEISLMGEIKGPPIFYWANFLY